MVLAIKAQLYRIKKAIACFRKDRNAFGLSYLLWKRRNANSTKLLQKYKGIHEGEKCFIVATGPSLLMEDLEHLDGIKTFGVNTLYKLYSDTEWRADYYCVIDPNTYGAIKNELALFHGEDLFIAGNRIRENNEEINKFALNCSSFYRLEYKDYFGATDFGVDLAEEIYDGASVVYAALQIAVYMGFTEIYLLGVDCNYSLEQDALHNSKLSYGKEYKYNWTAQTGLTMIECFKVAKEYADRHGVKIYNATRGGKLEVFPRVSLESVVKE